MENLLEVREPKEKESDLRKMFMDLGVLDTEEEKVINELFYNSVKMVFDAGFDLANELNKELLAETFKENLE